MLETYKYVCSLMWKKNLLYIKKIFFKKNINVYVNQRTGISNLVQNLVFNRDGKYILVQFNEINPLKEDLQSSLNIISYELDSYIYHFIWFRRKIRCNGCFFKYLIYLVDFAFCEAILKRNRSTKYILSKGW